MPFNPSNPDPQTTSTEISTEVVETVETVETPTPAPTPTPTPAPTNNAEILSAYNALLGDKARENAELQRRLAALEAERNAPPPKTAEEQSREFFERPLDLIRSEIDRSVKPLNDFVAKAKRDSDYAALKTQMRADPRFTRLSEIETDFDAMMASSPLEPNTMIGAYYAVLGMAVATGKLTATPTPKEDPPPPTPTLTTPPHLRPTNNTPAPAPTKTATRQLTENEKRVARLNRMTDEEYLKELEGPSAYRVS